MKSRFDVLAGARGIGALVLVLLMAQPAAAQSGASLTGRVTHAGTSNPMAGATVVVEELRREARTAADGTYRFDNLAPGNYHVSVRADGYGSRRAEVDVTERGATLDLEVEIDLHYFEVVSVSPNPRPQFESYQPTSVLSGQELAKQIEGTIGATLASEPGVAMRSLGPGPARPVIRGLDGDRVVILQDGQRQGDLSSQSGDHGVTVNPASAQRIEVVRGPATLLYGSSAIGGLVNVITDEIPTERMTGPSGNLTLDLGSNASEGAGAGALGWGNGTFAVHVGGGGRRASSYSTPDHKAENTQSRSGFFSVGAAWTRERSYVGGSVAYDNTKYGIPFFEGDEERVRITPRRTALTLRAGGQNQDGAFSSYRATLGGRFYEHTEFEGDEAGTMFDNDTIEGELLLSHQPRGRLSGTFGAWFLDRSFAAIGAEALSPPVDQRGVAAFFYEEITWPHTTLQFGSRVDRVTFDPEGGLPDRDFTEPSGSVGLLFRPAAANDDFVIATSLASAARNPALEELYFFGNHPGNLSFEIGNPTLKAERALGLDVSVRARTRRVKGEVTFFRNDIDDFIFRNPISGQELEDRDEEFEVRFGRPGESAGESGHGSEFPIIEYVGLDSVLWGIEAHADIEITRSVTAEVTYDWVRGKQKGSNLPLPRIPPYRVITGLRYQKNAFQVGGSVNAVARQSRVFGVESETAGYALLRLFGSYSFQQAETLHTITARLDNATDKLYRNHLNFLKDNLPEIGRNFKLVYTMGFQ